MMFRPVSLLLVALLCGCSKGEDDLVGRWVVPGHFPGMVVPRILFSPDGTGRVQNNAVGDIRMTWHRLDQGRFTLTQADGTTRVGCLSGDEINIRYQGDGRARILRYRRAQAWPGSLVFRGKASASQGLTCIP